MDLTQLQCIGRLKPIQQITDSENASGKRSLIKHLHQDGEQRAVERLRHFRQDFNGSGREVGPIKSALGDRRYRLVIPGDVAHKKADPRTEEITFRRSQKSSHVLILGLTLFPVGDQIVMT